MPRNRKKMYMDMYLTAGDTMALKKNRVVLKHINDRHFCIHPYSPMVKRDRKIAKLEAQVRALKKDRAVI